MYIIEENLVLRSSMKSAIVLAGGKSNRFRRAGCSDKALLKIGGKTLLERVMTVCLEVCDEVVIVGRNSLPREVFGARAIPDAPVKATGPFRGIYTGIREAKGDLCVVVSVDRPYLKPEVLELLLGEVSGVHAVVPIDFRGTVYPLLSCIRRSAVIDGMERVLSSEKKLRADEPLRMCKRVKFICLSFFRRADPSLRSFIDIDLPEDVDKEAVNTSPCDELFKITSASDLYWKGISHMRKNPLRAFESFLKEASLYEEQGIRMLQLHALADAYSIGKALGLQLKGLDAELGRMNLEIRGKKRMPA